MTGYFIGTKKSTMFEVNTSICYQVGIDKRWQLCLQQLQAEPDTWCCHRKGWGCMGSRWRSGRGRRWERKLEPNSFCHWTWKLKEEIYWVTSLMLLFEKKQKVIRGAGYLYLKLQLNEKMSILLSKSFSISKTVKYISFDYFLLFIGFYLLLNKKQLQPLRLLASKQVLYKP